MPPPLVLSCEGPPIGGPSQDKTGGGGGGVGVGGCASGWLLVR